MNHHYPLIAAEAAPVIYVAAILYWAYAGYQIYNGDMALNIHDALIRIITTALIFALLRWQGMASVIYTLWNDTVEHTIGLLISNRTDSRQLLSSLWQDVGQIASFLMEDKPAGIAMQGFGLMLLNNAFIICVLTYLAIAKIGMAVLMLFLPLFISFYFFQRTRQWMFNWINNLFFFGLLFILIHLLIHLSSLIYADALKEIHLANQLLILEKIDVTTTAYVYVIEGVLLYLMVLSKGWADDLSQKAGGAVQSSSVFRH